MVSPALTTMITNSGLYSKFPLLLVSGKWESDLPKAFALYTRPSIPPALRVADHIMPAGWYDL
jgi:hypothetical protein